jgi:hypothetical protein
MGSLFLYLPGQDLRAEFLIPPLDLTQALPVNVSLALEITNKTPLGSTQTLPPTYAGSALSITNTTPAISSNLLYKANNPLLIPIPFKL